MPGSVREGKWFCQILLPAPDTALSPANVAVTVISGDVASYAQMCPVGMRRSLLRGEPGAPRCSFGRGVLGSPCAEDRGSLPLPGTLSRHQFSLVKRRWTRTTWKLHIFLLTLL